MLQITDHAKHSHLDTVGRKGMLHRWSLPRGRSRGGADRCARRRTGRANAEVCGSIHRGPPQTEGQSGGSTACSSRIVKSALFGGGKPTDVKTFSNSSLDQRLRACSSESHTPTM